ncbi:MAG: pilus assembly protein [Alphaproteobacteria bacterium]|nr:pilus assembly protein [Alphaproteobacteria bacterium]
MSASRILKRFLGDRRGNMAVILAIALVPLILGIGVAVDISRAYVVRSRLAYALDAAGLAVGSTQGDQAALQTTMENFFYKNYPAEVMGTPTGLQMTIDSVNNTVALSASVNLETVFLSVVGVNYLDVSYSNEITREIKGLEVVLALDTTGSMASSGKIQALRTASQDLVDILFGEQTQPEKLRLGMVPFATAVNIGPSNSDYVKWGVSQYAPWISSSGETVNLSSYTTNADGTSTGTSWKGCVREREDATHTTNSPDVTDVYDGTLGTNGKWAPYYWPREPYSRPGSTSGNTYCRNRSSSNGVTSSNNVGTRWYSIDETATDSNYNQSGPNKSCPRAILPMTNNRSSIEQEISALVPWGDDTGTIVHVGLAWAWRVISPSAPFSEGVDYGTDGWNKAIILLTDGDNTSIRQSSCRTENNGPDHSYTGYGYTSDEGTIGTSAVSGYSARASAAVTNEDARLTEVCNNIKALQTNGKSDVVIYTIALGTGISTSVKNRLRSCASDTSKFFDSPSSEQLNAAFQQIAKELSKLRISK